MPNLAENPECNSRCFSCHYKNYSYSDQIEKKKRWAEKCLGEWRSVLSSIHEAPEEERIGYRKKSWMRIHKEGDQIQFGFYRAIHVQGRWEKEFIDWSTCPIHHPALSEILFKFSESAKKIPEAIDSLFGVWFGAPDLVWVGRGAIHENIRSLKWDEILTSPFTRVGFHQTNQVGRTIFGPGPIESIYESETNLRFRETPIGSFRQVARTLVNQARSDALAALLLEKPSLILDLYCGTGELSKRLPDSVGWIGIESDRAALERAKLIQVSSFVLREVFRGLVEDRLRDPKMLRLLSRPYSLYLNPPRPGLGEAGLESLIALLKNNPPLTIAYLSCSASSLARDLHWVQTAGYRVHSLQPYDFFPQTEHFETLAILKKSTLE